jgi:23S rRNA G2445 N2-methylase RlmL
MKAFAITNPGLEEYSAKEIYELIKTKSKIEDSVVIFDCDEEKLAYLCYKSQSLIKVCSLLEKIQLKKIDDLKVKIDFTKIIPKNKTYKVKAICLKPRDTASSWRNDL